ncbi:glycosyltransferase family 2 protein [Gramella sp. BOM4]|nr:glycosyltransferase family 2 protein [Christiangramia bathymodioli]
MDSEFSNTKVSVIIPAYNAERFIEKCLRSICNQTYTNLEIIVLNDGSSDSTEKLAKQFSEKDNRVTLITKENSGTYSTRKLGIFYSTGQVILNVDADDYLELDAIMNLVDKMRETKANLVIGNHYHLFRGKKKLISNRLPAKQSKMELVRSLLTNNIKGYIWGKLYRRELLTDLDYEVENMLQEDFLANLHVFLTKKVRIAQVDLPVYNYLVHANSANTSKNEVFIENVIRFNKIAEDLLRAHDCFEPLKKEFQLYKCRNWVVYARMGGVLAKDKEFIKNFYKENYTSYSRNRLPVYQNLEMQVYRQNYFAGKLLTRSFKKIQELIY